MLLLGALVSLALSAGPDPLSGCAATPTKDGWEYECSEFRAGVEDYTETFAGAADGMVHGMQEGAAALLGAGTETRREQRTLGGVVVDVYVMRRSAGAQACLMTVIESKAGLRTLFCFGQERGCGRAFVALADLPWRSASVPGSIRRVPPPLTIGGSPVPVPEGCQPSPRPDSGRVDCGKRAWVQWFRADAGTTRRASANQGSSIRETLVENHMTGTEDQVSCRIGGADTTCGRFIIDVPSGDDVLMLWGAVRAGDEFVFATCMATGAPEVRSPCSLLFKIVTSNRH